MITIPTAEQQAFQGSSPKNLILDFPIGRQLTNENIYMESMSLEQSVCDESNLTFGMVYSSCFKVRIFDDGLSYNNLKINPKITVEEDGTTYSRNLGQFTVKSDKLTSDKIYRDLTCYDALVDVLPFDYSQWHNQRPDTFTVKQYRDAFFSYIGITQASVTLPNDSVSLKKFKTDKVSGAQILSAILQINGAFGYIGSDGNFKYVFPKTTADYTISDSSFVQGTFDYEDEPIKKISGVTIEGYSDDYGEEESYTIANVKAGDATNSMVTLGDNYLIHACSQSTRQTICNNLYNKIKNFEYYPASVQFPVYIGLELGDVFKIATERKTVTFPVFKRTLTGISALKDTLQAQGESEITSNANSVSSSAETAQMAINQMRLSVSELLARKISVEELNADRARITTLETNYVTVNDTLTAHQANIESLDADKADITDLNAATARITTLETGYAHITELDADYANIKTLLSGNAGVGDLQNIHLTSANAVIDEAVIKNLVAQYITVNDLHSGTIDTSKFTIASPDGAINIEDGTQTFKDANGNTRIQIGLDAQDNFSFVLYDATGQGVLIDATGIKESAIADGLIKDAKVASNANIQASKLDIASLFNVINNDGSHTIQGNKIYLNEQSQTLTQAFTAVTETTTNLNNRVGIVETGINGLTVSLSETNKAVESLKDTDGPLLQITTNYSSSDSVTLTAHVIKNRVDVHTEYDTSCFTWYRKTEEEFTQIGTGYSITISRTDYGYGGTVVCRFEFHGKNLLPNTATSKTYNGITYTVNTDGSVTLNGTSTRNSSLTIAEGLSIPNDGLIGSGVTGGDGGTYRILVWGKDSSGTGHSVYITNGDKSIPSEIENVAEASINIMKAGITFNNFTIYPMIRKSGTSSVYEPYY